MDPRQSHDAGEKIVERLTDATAKAARPGAVARDLADGTVAGLALRVLPSGSKTWGLRARLDGQRIRVDLGTYPATTLKDARRKAHDALRIVERGDDPRYEGITVAAAVTEYLNRRSATAANGRSPTSDAGSSCTFCRSSARMASAPSSRQSCRRSCGASRPEPIPSRSRLTVSTRRCAGSSAGAAGTWVALTTHGADRQTHEGGAVNGPAA